MQSARLIKIFPHQIMIPKRIVTTLARCVVARPLAQTVARYNGIAPVYRLRPSMQVRMRWEDIRHHSVPASIKHSVTYNFKDIKQLSSNPSSDRILVDVREPSEFGAGAIPTAINIPIVSAPDALSLSDGEFEDRFGFAKPAADKELVFYCKAGVRSSAAAQVALQNGYGKVGEYRGSWLDWEKKVKEEV